MAWISPLKHELALEFLTGLAAVTVDQLAELDETARQQAFWISGATELSLVQDALERIGEGLVAGDPWGEFQEKLLTRLRRDWAGGVADPPLRLELITRNLGQRTYTRWPLVSDALPRRPRGPALWTVRRDHRWAGVADLLLAERLTAPPLRSDLADQVAAAAPLLSVDRAEYFGSGGHEARPHQRR